MLKHFAICALSASSLFAYNHPCPDHWQISGDFLYLLPSVDDTYFAISSPVSTTFPNGNRLNNDFGFSPGFRVGAEYSFCEPQRELQTYYTYLNTDQSKNVTGDYLWATIGRSDLASSFENYTGSASSKIKLFYQRLDVLFEQRIVNSSGLFFYVQPGIEYAYVRLNEHFSYLSNVPATATIQQKSKAWGIGPEMGFELGYTFYESALKPQSKPDKGKNSSDSDCCKINIQHIFSINALFSGSLLASKSFTRESNTLSSSSLLNAKDESTWRLIPALHARVGLNYDMNFNRVGLALGAGYEFNSYIRAISRTIFSDDVADGLCSTNYYNFDVQGLYVSAALSF